MVNFDDFVILSFLMISAIFAKLSYLKRIFRLLLSFSGSKAITYILRGPGLVHIWFVSSLIIYLVHFLRRNYFSQV